MLFICIIQPFLLLLTELLAVFQLLLSSKEFDELSKRAYFSNEEGMSRKYFDQMLDDLQITNFPGYQRWYAFPNPPFYAMPDMHQDFRNVARFNRYELCPADYYRQTYWMPQGFVFPNYEPFYLLRRNDKRSFHVKGHNFPKDRRINGEKRFYPDRQENGGNFRINRGKTSDFHPHFERRFPPGWNNTEGVSQQNYHLPRENRNMQRMAFGNSNIDLCEDMLIDQHLHNFNQMFENRNPSSECLTMNANGSAARVDSSGDAKISESDWKDQDCKTDQKPDDSECAVSSDFASGYESWYCQEEQQQIVDMLKEVNMRHDRQLKRDMLVSRSERPCSDESVSSNNDWQSANDYFQNTSSDDDDDDIHILLSPSAIPSIPEAANEEEEEEELTSAEYHEKSASDFFEEFQNIFTVSPEKKIINILTKESKNAKNPLNRQDEEYEVVGQMITEDDKDAVRAVLNFEKMEELSEKDFGECASIVSSSPKEASNQALVKETLPNQSTDVPCGCEKIIQEAAQDDKTVAKLDDTSHATQMDPIQALRSELPTNEESSFVKKESLQVDCCSAITSRYDSGTVDKRSPSKAVPNTSPDRNGYRTAKNSKGIGRMTHGKDFKVGNVSSERMSSKKVNKTPYNIFKRYKKEFDISQWKAETQHTHSTSNRNYFETNSSSTNSSKGLQKNKPVQREESGSSVSEPLLTPKNDNVVYKRISISEIFKSVSSNSKQEFDNFLNQKHQDIKSLIKECLNTEQLSPSEHLKQILGIGKKCSSQNYPKREKEENNRSENKLSGNGRQNLNLLKSPQSSSNFVTTKKPQNFPRFLETSDSSKNSSFTPVTNSKKLGKTQNGNRVTFESAAKFYSQNPKGYSRNFKRYPGEYRQAYSTSSSFRKENRNQSYLEVTNRNEAECNTNVEKEINSNPYKEYSPKEDQPERKFINEGQSYQSKEKYSGKKFGKVSKSNWVPREKDNRFQKNAPSTDKIKKEESQKESLESEQHKMANTLENKSPNSKTSQNEGKMCEQLGAPPANKSKSEQPKSKKKYKKKKLEKTLCENDNETHKTWKDSNNDGKYNYKGRNNFESVSNAIPQDKNPVMSSAAKEKQDESKFLTETKDATKYASNTEIKMEDFVLENGMHDARRSHSKGSVRDSTMESFKSQRNEANTGRLSFREKRKYDTYLYKNYKRTAPVSEKEDSRNKSRYLSDFENVSDSVSNSGINELNSVPESNEFNLRNSREENSKPSADDKEVQDSVNKSSNYKAEEGDIRCNMKGNDNPPKNLSETHPQDKQKMTSVSEQEEFHNEPQYLSNRKFISYCSSKSKDNELNSVGEEYSRNSNRCHDEDNSKLVDDIKNSPVDSEIENPKFAETTRNDYWYNWRERDNFRSDFTRYHRNSWNSLVRKKKRSFKSTNSLEENHVGDSLSSSSALELNSSEKKEHHNTRYSEDRDSKLRAENKYSEYVPSAKNLKVAEVDETGSKHREYFTGYKYQRKENYSTRYQYRERNRYWKEKNQYNDSQYFVSEKYRKPRVSLYDEERRKGKYFRQETKDYRQNILVESNENLQNDNSNMNSEAGAQLLVTVDPTNSFQAKVIPSGRIANSSEVEIASPELGSELCKRSSATGTKRKNRSPSPKVFSVFRLNVANTFLVDPILLSLVSEIRSKARQILKEVDNVSYLPEKLKSQFETLKKISENLSLDYINCKVNTQRNTKQSLSVNKLNRTLSILPHMSTSESGKQAFFRVRNAMGNILGSKLNLMLNHSFDVYVQLQLKDILYQFNSVRLSENLQRSLQLSLISTIDGNILQGLPVFLLLLSVLSALNLPWTRSNLRELFDLGYYNRPRNGVKLEQMGEKSDNLINNVMKCWDIFSRYFTNKKILGIRSSHSRN